MRIFVLPIFDGVIMDGHPIFQSWWIPATPASTTQNIGCPSIMTPSKMGKTKNLIFYSLINKQTNRQIDRRRWKDRQTNAHQKAIEAMQYL